MGGSNEDDIASWLTSARALWFEGKPEEALVYFERAVAALSDEVPAPVRIDAQSGYCLCLCEVGQLEKALGLYPDIYRQCGDLGVSDVAVLRQWAKALEQSGDFKAARLTYEKVPPDDQTDPMDRLKWHHAVGLLNWRDGRLSAAQENLAQAVANMPKDPKQAADVLAVLGNDALLALEVGHTARAFRLAQRMHQIYETADRVSLSNEINFVKLRAALARESGDMAQVAAIFRAALDLVEERASQDWMRKLDLANEYVMAVLQDGPDAQATAYLQNLCTAAPAGVAWIGRFLLARVQIQAGDHVSARENLTEVMAALLGSGSPESEISIVLEVANLFNLLGHRSAAIFFGKLTLGYLDEMARTLDTIERPILLREGRDILHQTVVVLQASARFEEALALQRVFDRVQHTAHMTHVPHIDSASMPLSGDETLAKDIWLTGRQQIARMREEGQREAARARVVALLDDVMRLDAPAEGRDLGPHLALPVGQNVRIAILCTDDLCDLHVAFADGARTFRLNVTPAALFLWIAELREAVADGSAWQDPAARLYQILLRPISDRLTKGTCLEVDASGVLGRIPFNLLLDAKTCLAETVTIRYVVDAGPPLRADPSGRKGLIHFAAFQSGPLARPPGVLASAAPPLQPARFVSGAGFTQSGFRDALMNRPSYVSVATHLDVVPNRPDITALWLGSDAPFYLSELAGDEYDLKGVQIAVFATCSSSVASATDIDDVSLAALALEKGVQCVIGTIWDISEAAAAQFVDLFWTAFEADPTKDIAHILADLQAGFARDQFASDGAQTAVGGIGDHSLDITPIDWAGFGIFVSRNTTQHCDVHEPTG